jgi:two-component system response regulator NreC
MAITVLLADDHTLFRQGIRVLIEQEDDMALIAEADNGRKAVRIARKVKPKIAILDITMKDLNGIEAARQICSENPAVRVIALSMHSDRRLVRGMLEAGASGYLLKDCTSEELIRCIRSVNSGNTYLSQAIVNLIAEDFASTPNAQPWSSLSPRQIEVLQLIAEGKNTKEIADCLYVSTKTIETYRRQLMNKLNVNSIVDLVKFAVREGITSLDP